LICWQCKITPDTRVYYENRKGDDWRYLSEHKVVQEKQNATASGKDAYDCVVLVAKQEIPLHTPAYLGLILNYSVCRCEIIGQLHSLTKRMRRRCSPSKATRIRHNERRRWRYSSCWERMPFCGGTLNKRTFGRISSGSDSFGGGSRFIAFQIGA
jgi:hypothetical protein